MLPLFSIAFWWWSLFRITASKPKIFFSWKSLFAEAGRSRLQLFIFKMSRPKKKKTEEKENTEDFSPLRRTLGVIFAMASCVFFAFSSLFVKLLREIPPQEVVFFRSLVQVIFVLPPLIYSEVPVFEDTKHLPFLWALSQCRLTSRSAAQKNINILSSNFLFPIVDQERILREKQDVFN